MRHPRYTLGAPASPLLLLLLLLLCPLPSPASAGGESVSRGLSQGGVVEVLADAVGSLQSEPLDLFGAKGAQGEGGKGQGAAASNGAAPADGRSTPAGEAGKSQGEQAAHAAESSAEGGGGGAGASEGGADAATLGAPLLPQRAFMNHSSLGFASFSAYRLAGSHFVVVGHSLVDRILGVTVTDLTCEWHYTDTSGAPQVVYGTLYADAPALKWGPNYPYYLMLLFCQLDKTPISEPGVPAGGTRNEGGVEGVRLQEQTSNSGRGSGAEKGQSRVARTLEGQDGEGLLKLNLGGYTISTRPEHSRLLANVGPGEAPGTPPSELLAFCGPPMFRTKKYPSLNPYGIQQWVRYHQHVLGYDRLYFYDAGALPDEAREALKGEIASGVVVITDFLGEKQYYAWADAQLLAMHDCLYRNRGVASWVGFADFDEYLQVKALPSPFQSLRGFLRWAADEGYAEVSHGCMIFHLLCEEGHVEPLWGPEQSKYAVELLPYRGEVPYCTFTERGGRRVRPDKCYDFAGHRKYFANPLKVGSVKVHSLPGVQDVHYPAGSYKSYGFSVKEVYHAHYHGLLRPHTECTTLDKVTTRLDSWSKAPESRLVRDAAVAEMAKAARECAARGKESGHQCPAWEETDTQKEG